MRRPLTSSSSFSSSSSSSSSTSSPSSTSSSCSSSSCSSTHRSGLLREIPLIRKGLAPEEVDAAAKLGLLGNEEAEAAFVDVAKHLGTRGEEVRLDAEQRREGHRDATEQEHTRAGRPLASLLATRLVISSLRSSLVASPNKRTTHVTLSPRLVKHTSGALIKDGKLPRLQLSEQEADAVAEPVLWGGG